MAYPDKAKFFFSGVRKVLQPIDVTAALLRLMVKQKDMICILESRSLLYKITGIWLAVGKFRGKLGKNGVKSIKKLPMGRFYDFTESYH
jgi:hypothetical protein